MRKLSGMSVAVAIVWLADGLVRHRRVIARGRYAVCRRGRAPVAQQCYTVMKTHTSRLPTKAVHLLPHLLRLFGSGRRHGGTQPEIHYRCVETVCAGV